MDTPIINNPDLTDPITFELFEDPVNLPCCGRALSRQPLLSALHVHAVCPLCRAPLDVSWAETAPKAINLAYMVDQLNNSLSNLGVKPVSVLEDNKTTWSAQISCLSNNQTAYRTVVGQLQLKHTGASLQYKTLLIPVIDKSGSMSGTPIEQVKYSLNRIIDSNYRNPHVVTEIITYCDRATNTELKLNLPPAHWTQYISTIDKSMGGTCFKAAFDSIVTVCQKHIDDKNITSAIVLFLTDGEDSGSTPRSELVTTLKRQLATVWTKPYTVHTVGFGRNHDHTFLDSLRKIGSTEGAYRFADPSENNDILSGKINSILDVIFESTAVPIKLDSAVNSPPIIAGSRMKYWIDLTGFRSNADDDGNSEYTYLISINNSAPIDVVAKIDEAESNQNELWEEWCSHLIDGIAEELIVLSNQPGMELDKQIHCELLKQRCQSISARFQNGSPNFERLSKLQTALKTIMAGQVVGTLDKLKLTDLKYEGQFTTAVSGTSNTSVNTTAQITGSSAYYTPVIQNPSKQNWVELPCRRYKRCCGDKNSPTLFQVIGQNSNASAISYVKNGEDLNIVDKNGSDPICAASSIGRYRLLDTILDYSNSGYFERENKYNHNAIDVAVLYGYWKCLEVLFKNGYVNPKNEWRDLLTTALAHRHFKTAEIIINKGYVKITPGLVDAAPHNVVWWLSKYTSHEINMETAITKGLVDQVQKKLDSVQTISWDKYISVLSKPTEDHMKIISLLTTHNKVDLCEELNIQETTTTGPMAEITWPLFIAADKGNTELVSFILDRIDENKRLAHINKQNNRGTTALWIACCNKHVDTVLALLTAEADPNVVNYKGDSPLVACIQKGSEAIVQILLDAGARLDAYNKNRDNPILIACRNGQSRILETLLKTYQIDAERQHILETYAEIDGFCPIFASVELDRTECIKVCVKYGANLESRTSETNEIIAGATPLHLASYYGRVAAATTLVALGGDLKAKTSVYGHTPLHVAIRQGHISLVRFLLSLPEGKACLDVNDDQGRSPIYYARTGTNQELYNEFFNNKLVSLFDRVIYSAPMLEQKCAKIIMDHGRSLGCYEYHNITGIDMGAGTTLLTHAFMNNNQHLVSSLLSMNGDMYKPDDYGIKPIFWAKFFGHGGFVSDDETQQQLKRIQAINQQGFQNKFLTTIARSNSGELEKIEFPTLEQVPKMSHAFGAIVSSATIQALGINGKSKSLSILGFLEKLKNSTVFSPGKQALEYVLREAKVHLIKLLASGKVKDPIQPLHAMAIYLYTSNHIIYQRVNEVLINWATESVWHPYIYCLYQGLSLLPPYQGEVYRGVEAAYIPENYALGQIICWQTFSLCSTQWKSASDLITRKLGIVFIIKSKNSRRISDFAIDPASEEVVFLPNTSFIITNHYRPDIIALGQANIRHSTFAIRDRDFGQAFTGKASIIVELEEIIDITSLRNVVNDSSNRLIQIV